MHMIKNARSYGQTIVCIWILFLLSNSFVRANEDVRPSINSLNESDHFSLMLELSTAAWTSCENSRGTTCKYYNPSITLDGLKSILMFTDGDLKEVEGDVFDESSMVWKTCNYLLYAGGGESSKVLNWFKADLAIENDLAVLLLRHIETGDELYEALYIYKPRQQKANFEIESGSLWGDLINLIHSLIWGHPKI